MPANRRVIRPANAAGPFAGAAFMDDVGEEIEKLWDHAQLPLTGWGGTANAQTAQCVVTILGNGAGRQYLAKFALANTGALTLAIDGKPAQPVVNRDGTALTAGRINPARWEEIYDDGAAFVLLNDPPPPQGGVLRSLFAYQLAAGQSGAGTAAGWNTYRLNTAIINDIPGVTLDAVNFRLTLPARTYNWFEADAFVQDNRAGLYLWNVSDNQLIPGQARSQSNTSAVTTLRGSFTLAATKQVELRLYQDIAGGAGRLGLPLNITAPAAIPEQYGSLVLESFS